MHFQSWRKRLGLEGGGRVCGEGERKRGGLYVRTNMRRRRITCCFCGYSAWTGKEELKLEFGLMRVVGDVSARLFELQLVRQ